MSITFSFDAVECLGVIRSSQARGPALVKELNDNDTSIATSLRWFFLTFGAKTPPGIMTDASWQHWISSYNKLPPQFTSAISEKSLLKKGDKQAHKQCKVRPKDRFKVLKPCEVCVVVLTLFPFIKRNMIYIIAHTQLTPNASRRAFSLERKIRTKNRNRLHAPAPGKPCSRRFGFDRFGIPT